MKLVNLVWIVPLMVMNFTSASAWAQDSNQDSGGMDPHFAMMNSELSAVCGPFLPNNINGITELMSLCGGRLGIKLSPKTTLEPQLLAGAGNAQRYILGSVNFRGDVQLDDMVGSFYGGATVHYATNPVFDPNGGPTTDQTNIYFGVDVGGAVWWMVNDWWGIRTDLQFNLNPGTSLFVGFSLVFRFDPSGEVGQSSP